MQLDNQIKILSKIRFRRSFKNCDNLANSMNYFQFSKTTGESKISQNLRLVEITKPAFTCSKLAIETIEKGLKHV